MNVGIVGCGYVAPDHLDALRDIKNCRVVSVCDINKDKAVAMAKKYGISKIYTDFSLMLQKEKLNIIHVLTPPQVHAPLSIEAMEAGCHVLVEKPMAMTVQETNQMIKAAERNNVKLGVVHSFLFNPGIRKALDIVRRGKIGELLWTDTILSVYSLLKWEKKLSIPKMKWHQSLPGGIFGEIIPHGLYVQLAFLGNSRKVVGLTKKGEKDSALAPFSEMQVVMDCDSGIGGLFMSARVKSPYTMIMVRVVGTRGVLLVNVPTATVIKIKLRNSAKIFARALINLEAAGQLIYSSTSLGTKTLLGSVKRGMTHRILIKRFIESVKKGSELPVTPEEGREVVRATNMIWERILT